MKRSLLNRILKPTYLAIPAAALMLGASQSANGQSQFGINFFGSGYHYGNTNVTATAFGIDPTNWFTTPGEGDGIGYNGKSGTSVIAMPAGGALTVTWTCANTWDSGIGDNGSGLPSPGDPEVLWGYLDDTSPGYSVTLSGLRSFSGSYSLQTIAANSSATTGFPNVTLLTNNVASEIINYTNDPSQFVSGNGGVYALSTLSTTYPTLAGNDSITFKPAARSGSIRSTLAGIILNYVPGNNAPLIATQPQSATNNLFIGSSFSLSATANGSPTFSYQWRQGGVPIPGATNSTYAKNSGIVADSGNYDLVVTNNFGAVTSAVAVVTIQNITAPTIIQAPLSQSLYPTYPATFTVSAVGGQLTYQWKYNNNPITGATNATYTIASVNNNFAGTYSVAINNPAGPTANASATLSIKTPTPGSFEEIMSQTRPDVWYRYSETGAVAQDAAANSGGSLGAAGTGLYVGVTHAVPGAIVASTNKAAYFNGASSVVSVPFNAQLNTSAFTAEAWVNPSASLASGILLAPLSCGDFASPRKGWLIYQSSTGWDLRAYNNNGTSLGMEVVGGSIPQTNTWYHLAVTYNGTVMTLYVNGVSVGSATDTGGLYVPGTAGPFAVGARADNSFYWNGSVDEVAAYGSALTAGQILAHYQNGINASPAQSYSALIASDNPLMYLRLGEPAFTSTVAQNSGTTGSAWNGALTDAGGAVGHPQIALGQSGPLPPTYVGFESTNSALSMTNGYNSAPPLPLSNSVTAVSWVYRQDPASAGDLGWISWFGDSGLSGFYIASNGDLHEQWLNLGGSYGYAFGLNVPAQTWTFVAMVVTPTTTTMYMSSGTNLLSSVHTFTHNGLSDVTPLTFGGGQPGRGTRTFVGQLDESAVYSRALTADQVTALFQTSVGAPRTLQIVPGGVVQDSKPVGTPYNGLNKNTTWLPSSADFNSLTRTGVEQFSATNNGQITIPANTDLNPTNGTICFWVNYLFPFAFPGTGNEAAMLFDHRTTSGAVIALNTSGGIQFQAAGGASFTGSTYVVDGNWHHITITYGQTTNDTVSVYVDGNLDTAIANPGNWTWPTNQQIELGRSHDAYWYIYDGQMDDVRIYNRILTQPEISSIVSTDALVDTSALKLRFNFTGDNATYGNSLIWLLGSLQSSPVLGPGAVWTTVTNAASPQPVLINPANPTMFYRTALSPY